MTLLYQGPGGSIEQRWLIYALLSDNVQHHIEHGRPSGQFAALHGISRALGAPSLKLPARQLHEELARALSGLGDRPVSELAISDWTRAVVGLSFPLPTKQNTRLVRDCDVAPSLLPGPARSMTSLVT